MTYRIPSLIVLVGGTLILTAATANAAPPMVRTLPSNPGFPGYVPAPNRGVMPGSNPRTWSPYPINNRVMPGSDPRTWSPYPINNNVMPGSDPRTWSPYPLYPTYRYLDNGPIPYWLQNPNWRQAMPAVPYIYPVLPYVNPYAGSANPFLNPYAYPFLNPYAGSSLPLDGYNLYE
jgi:hypothetical protein